MPPKQRGETKALPSPTGRAGAGEEKKAMTVDAFLRQVAEQKSSRKSKGLGPGYTGKATKLIKAILGEKGAIMREGSDAEKVYYAIMNLPNNDPTRRAFVAYAQQCVPAGQRIGSAPGCDDRKGELTAILNYINANRADISAAPTQISDEDRERRTAARQYRKERESDEPCHMLDGDVKACRTVGAKACRWQPQYAKCSPKSKSGVIGGKVKCPTSATGTACTDVPGCFATKGQTIRCRAKAKTAPAELSAADLRDEFKRFLAENKVSAADLKSNIEEYNRRRRLRGPASPAAAPGYDDDEYDDSDDEGEYDGDFYDAYKRYMAGQRGSSSPRNGAGNYHYSPRNTSPRNSSPRNRPRW